MNPLYDYVFWIGNTEFPSWQDDAQGKIYRSDSERAWDFVHQLEDGKLDFPFTQEQYLANEPVIRSLRAMDIELDKFWYAMLFVYDLVRERTEGVMQVPLSDFDQLRAFIHDRPSPCQTQGLGRTIPRSDRRFFPDHKMHT